MALEPTEKTSLDDFYRTTGSEPETSEWANVPLNKDEKKGLHSKPSPSTATPTPGLEDSWKAVMREVVEIDDDQFKSWKEDIDTLLVFVCSLLRFFRWAPDLPVTQAGLFSAVVTAFTIESYKWLSEDPQDTAVTLLMRISQQMGNVTNGTVTPIEPFKASPSNIRINTFWFLSLIIALVDALFGLLCKQWLREHRRPTHTRTPQEALALHWLRRESLQLWNVSTFVATPPHDTRASSIPLFCWLAGAPVESSFNSLQLCNSCYWVGHSLLHWHNYLAQCHYHTSSSTGYPKPQGRSQWPTSVVTR
ncbi:hypothetical protein V5O48_015646 [Marasmius crinis-equi]|uniref:DUF6535 domain-containing protein n=1 Tax=Marasmius crinis-equi TaxID=585013 RepID=A0ABR3ETY4_9AGAR